MSGLGDSLVPAGNTSLPEPMLDKIEVAIWSHWDAMS